MKINRLILTSVLSIFVVAINFTPITALAVDITPVPSIAPVVKNQSTVFWQDNSNGQPIIWTIGNNGKFKARQNLPNPGTDWRLVTSTDFNRDKNPDVLWQNIKTGQPVIWFLSNKGEIVGSNDYAYLGNPGTNWRLVGAADFNNDAYPDLLWQYSNGQPAVWYLDRESKLINGAYLTTLTDPSWLITDSKDLNADGVADLLFQNTSTGQPAVWVHNLNMSIRRGNGFESVGNPGLTWKIRSWLDLNRDGTADIIWQNVLSGQSAVWYLNRDGDFVGGEFLGNLNNLNQVVVGGQDFDFDGSIDLLFKDLATQQPVIWYRKSAGISWVEPIPEDIK